jgi:ornithine cyclodeaminase/alanine dehydrogenase-like protein (mu-crystallin family)
LTLVLSEKDVGDLLDMREVIPAVEEAFRREGLGEAKNSARTRSRGPSSDLNVMHANLPYLQRGGIKAYMSSEVGTKFTLLLFDTSDSTPLAVMGADTLGRFRTGAASGVATKHLYGRPSGILAIFGSGKQALTQVLALSAVMSLEEVRVWSPTPDHGRAFVHRLLEGGYKSSDANSPGSALEGAQVACAITSSGEPFLTGAMVRSVSHMNICGSNVPQLAEMTPGAVGSFNTVVVDDITQARVEYGDLIQAAKAGTFSWDAAVELGSIVAGRRRASGRTLFKSGGAALEDVAVASLLYDKARKSGRTYPNVELV